MTRVKFHIVNNSMRATVYKENECEVRIISTENGKFLSLSWEQRDEPYGPARQVNAYLSRNDVQALIKSLQAGMEQLDN